MSYVNSEYLNQLCIHLHNLRLNSQDYLVKQNGLRVFLHFESEKVVEHKARHKAFQEEVLLKLKILISGTDLNCIATAL